MGSFGGISGIREKKLAMANFNRTFVHELAVGGWIAGVAFIAFIAFVAFVADIAFIAFIAGVAFVAHC